jgi:predicted nucleic acid-binding protein
MMTMEVVLDSWAVMAWLKGEQPAAAQVRILFEAVYRRERHLAMSVVNMGEVFYLSAKAKGLTYGEHVLENLRSRVKTISVNDDQVMQAAGLKARYPISYADAFAAATAMNRRSALMTGDPELRAMAEQEKSLALDWIGK